MPRHGASAGDAVLICLITLVVNRVTAPPSSSSTLASTFVPFTNLLRRFAQSFRYLESRFSPTVVVLFMYLRLRRCRLPFSSVLDFVDSIVSDGRYTSNFVSDHSSISAHLHLASDTAFTSGDAGTNRNFPPIVKNAQAMPPPTMFIFSCSINLLICFAFDFPSPPPPSTPSRKS
ncbi:hypothetical protein R3P38DRAFT_3482276 [Favolaschia claudopus]|uniref:Secreted protein n=1 Tax=Favolaschia claudopus TaxID=2862362 RepID=A0AAV9Z8W1_9AGAR